MLALILVVARLETGTADFAGQRASLIRNAADTQISDWATPEDPRFSGVTGDVVWSDTRQEGFMRLSGMPVNDPARGQLEQDRDRLYARIIRKLDSRAFRLFIFDLFAWLHMGKWLEGKKAGGPLMPFAIKRLDRLWAKIVHRASGLHRLSDEERHKLRIDTKKLRYAIEFLSEPLRGAEVERAKFVKAAEGIQDRLGELNDLATWRLLLFAPSPASSAKDRSRHLRSARRHFNKLREIGPFWGGCAG